eukprot:765017-Hanusia_phi.AAC.4
MHLSQPEAARQLVSTKAGNFGEMGLVVEIGAGRNPYDSHWSASIRTLGFCSQESLQSSWHRALAICEEKHG